MGVSGLADTVCRHSDSLQIFVALAILAESIFAVKASAPFSQVSSFRIISIRRSITSAHELLPDALEQQIRAFPIR